MLPAEEPTGRADHPTPTGAPWQQAAPGLTQDDLLDMYYLLLLSRALDERMWILNRQGKAPFVISCQGQEAAQVGLISGFSPVGTQIPQAAGRALAARVRGQSTVAAANFGEGTTSQGDFHEGLNFAAVHRLPVVFVCENNGYAISVPSHRQMAVVSLADRAGAYGIPGASVDGTDSLECYRAMRQAVDRARRGEGPTLIEARVLRFTAHSSDDDDRGYRPAGEVEEARKRDPILRFRLYLQWQEVLNHDRERYKVVAPATPYDAKGLLKAAIRDDDPVIFFEHKKTYRTVRGEVPDGDYVVPIGKAEVKRSGNDVTILSYGLMLHYSLEAAERLEDEGLSLEVVDLRTLHPLDRETILASARKTGKVLVVHEANQTGGLGGELAAIVAQEAFDHLDGPVMRLAGPDIPAMPFSPPLERFYMLSPDRIAAAAREVANY